MKLIPAGHRKLKCSKDLSWKPEEVRGPILMILYALIGLLLCTLPLAMGLRGLSVTAKSHLVELREHYDMFQQEASRERYVHQQWNWLKIYPLKERLFEDHTTCLGRGIDHVNNMFTTLSQNEYIRRRGGDWLNYPDLVHKTIAWVKYHCYKLHFTPHKPTPNYSSGWAYISRQWAFISHHTKRIHALLQSWRRRNRNQAQATDVSQDPSSAKGRPDQKANKKLPDMPPNFGFDCNDSLCKLVYNPPTTPKYHDFNSTLVKSAMDNLEILTIGTETWLKVIDPVSDLLLSIQLVLFVVLFCLDYDRPLSTACRLQLLQPRTWPASIRQLSPLASYGAAIVALLGISLTERKVGVVGGLFVWSALAVLAFFNFLNFFFPCCLYCPHVGYLYAAVEDLTNLVMGRPNARLVAAADATKVPSQAAKLTPVAATTAAEEADDDDDDDDVICCFLPPDIVDDINAMSRTASDPWTDIDSDEEINLSSKHQVSSTGAEKNKQLAQSPAVSKREKQPAPTPAASDDDDSWTVV